MIEIMLEDKSANDCMDMVRALRKQGLIQGRDFDFSYHHAGYNVDGYEAVRPKHVKFKFYTDRDATMFALRWS
jgi:hypothetical protein